MHSLLSENSLLNPAEHGLKIHENSKLLGFLSNSASLSIRSIDVFQNAKPTTIRPCEKRSDVATLRHLSFEGQAIHLTQVHGLPRATKNDELPLNLLPAIQQFDRLWTKWLQNKLHQINSAVYKVTVWFGGLNIAIDSARLMHQPNLANVKKVALDSSYLYSMYSGVNGYSAAISGVEAAYQISLGEYQQAFNIVVTTVSATALPYILIQVGNPYLSLAYGTLMAMYTVGNAISNAYEFATELMAKDAALKSAEAYKSLFEWCSASPLQAVYDFKADAMNYKLQVNAILFEREKLEAKAQTYDKPEFGQKAFDYCKEAKVDERYCFDNPEEQTLEQVAAIGDNGIELLNGPDV